MSIFLDGELDCGLICTEERNRKETDEIMGSYIADFVKSGEVKIGVVRQDNIMATM
jgi:hypothetical protein